MDSQNAEELSLGIAGPRAWHTIEHAYQQADRIAQEAVGNIPCRSCSGEEGLELVRGIHDVKNVELGKPVFDPEAFKHFKARVEDAADKAGIGPERMTVTQSSQSSDTADTLIFVGILGFIGLVGFLATHKPAT